MSDTANTIYAYCVRNALRRKPTLIRIGEPGDKARIESAVETALQGTPTVTYRDDEIEWVYDGTKEG